VGIICLEDCTAKYGQKKFFCADKQIDISFFADQANTFKYLPGQQRTVTPLFLLDF
jgi:hypothetical protein